MPPSLLSLPSFHLAQPNVYATFSPDSSEPLSHLEMATLASRCLWPTTASSSIFLPGTYFRGKCRFSKASQPWALVRTVTPQSVLGMFSESISESIYSCD